jgi:DNA-binding NarL/FixJ family response regulator
MTNKTERVLARISHKRAGDAKVLIVVDKYLSGKNLKNILEEWAYNVIGVCISGQDALVRVKKDKPELVLTDMELNGCKGIKFSHRFDLQTDSSNLCIYFTAYATDLIVQRTKIIATAMGCNINTTGTEEFYSNFETCLSLNYETEQTMNNIKHLPVNPIRVLLVDDQQIVLWGLKKLIDSENPRMEVIGTTTNISEAKRIVREKQPDILILNIYLDDIDCVSSIPDFTNDGNTRVVIFTETDDAEVIDRAVLSGARGIVHRKESMQTILRAIEKIHDGELWLDRITTARIFLQNSLIREKVSHVVETEKTPILTPKECVILKAFSDGSGGEQNKQIAARLCMSEHTLRNHLTSIFSKLRIKNRFSLFAYAKQHFQQSDSISSANDPF